MKELLFFVLGMVVGSLSSTVLLCCLQINRINEMERKYLKLKAQKSQEVQNGREE